MNSKMIWQYLEQELKDAIKRDYEFFLDSQDIDDEVITLMQYFHTHKHLYL